MFSRVAARAGFASRLIRRDIDSLSRLLLPCILVLRNGKACILESLDRKNKPRQGHFARKSARVRSGWKSDRAEGGLPRLRLPAQARIAVGGAQPQTAGSLDSSHWFWGTLRKSREIFWSVVLSSILINMFVLATPLFTMNVYDKVVPNDALETLWVLAAGIVTIYLFDTVLRFVRTYLLEIAGKKSDVIMSSILFSQVLNLKLSQWPQSASAHSPASCANSRASAIFSPPRPWQPWSTCRSRLSSCW